VAQPQVTPAVASGALDTFNVRIVSDANNNTIISWDNNTATYPEVVFGFTSQPGDNQQQYKYDFTTGRLGDLNAHHDVNLGQLEINRVYYIRLISRATDGASDITSEMTYIPVPSVQANQTQVNGSASVLSTLGNFLMSSWFILVVLILAIVILIALILSKRRNNNQDYENKPTTHQEVAER
jgi:preprotein translocase subunit SecG